MINISSLGGRIGEFWWINAQPGNPLRRDLLPGLKSCDLVLWGSCGFGRDLRLKLEALSSGEVE